MKNAAALAQPNQRSHCAWAFPSFFFLSVQSRSRCCCYYYYLFFFSFSNENICYDDDDARGVNFHQRTLRFSYYYFFFLLSGCAVVVAVGYVYSVRAPFLSSPPYKAARLITLLLYFIVLYCTKAKASTSKVLCWCVKALIVLCFSLFFYSFIFWNMIEPSERNHSTIVVGVGLSNDL